MATKVKNMIFPENEGQNVHCTEHVEAQLQRNFALAKISQLPNQLGRDWSITIVFIKIAL